HAAVQLQPLRVGAYRDDVARDRHAARRGLPVDRLGGARGVRLEPPLASDDMTFNYDVQRRAILDTARLRGPHMTTLLYTHPGCLEHDPGRHHPESPARL